MNLTPFQKYIDEISGDWKLFSRWVKFGQLGLRRNEFGKRGLLLGMFIPCKDGKPLEKPEGYSNNGVTHYKCTVEEFDEYQFAESKVIFKGWKLIKPNVISKGDNEIVFTGIIYIRMYQSFGDYDNSTLKTIEDIAHLNPELTKTGEKQLL